MKETFIATYREHIKRPGAEELLDWLCNSTDFFTAPASTKYHSSHDGGLCDHSEFVHRRLSCAPTSTDEAKAIVALLHDVCKTNFYKGTWRNEKIYDSNGSKRDEGGRFDWHTVPGWVIEDQFPYGHGEKSVFLIERHMRLTDEEAMAIRWHMGFTDDSFKGGSYSLGAAFEKYPLALHLHIADLQASYLDETK